MRRNEMKRDETRRDDTIRHDTTGEVGTIGRGSGRNETERRYVA